MTLQGIGKVNAVSANEIKAGDVLLWNFGCTSTVKAIRITAKSIILTTTSNGREYQRRLLKGSEVCIVTA